MSFKVRGWHTGKEVVAGQDFQEGPTVETHSSIWQGWGQGTQDGQGRLPQG